MRTFDAVRLSSTFPMSGVVLIFFPVSLPSITNVVCGWDPPLPLKSAVVKSRFCNVVRLLPMVIVLRSAVLFATTYTSYTGLAASIKACSPVVIGTVMFFLIGSAGSASSIINRLLGT
ncbi:hypothetical protein SDC9_176921 [bioreactor metagenome]|uniref:Uncharacterized protein n=1 Tax=bioreactor metagenome TaxID=1076179 RepID=A0A645GRJ2_9ZZZZ